MCRSSTTWATPRGRLRNTSITWGMLRDSSRVTWKNSWSDLHVVWLPKPNYLDQPLFVSNMWCWWTYTKNHVSRCVFIETTLNVIHKKLQNSRGMIWHIQNVHLRKAKDKKVAYKQILSSAHTHTQVALNLPSPTIHTERYTIHNVQMKWLSKELKTCLAKNLFSKSIEHGLTICF